MNNIQQLIKKYVKSKSSDAMNEIITALQHQDSLWVAYSPSTKNHYADFYRGTPTAYLFSEERFCSAFKKYLSGKGTVIEPMENLDSERIVLFSDFLRNGIEQIIIDNGQTFVILNLADIINSPDFSSLPENERPVVNPSLMMHTNFYFQGVGSGASGSQVEQDMMRDIYDAKYLLPVSLDGSVPEGSELMRFNTGSALIDIPSVRIGAKRLCIPVFTDWLELSKLDKEKKCAGNVITFGDIERICSTGQLVSINPFGFNLIMDSTTVRSIKNRFCPESEDNISEAEESAVPEAAVEEAAENVSAEAEESAVPEAAIEEAAENVTAEAEESAVPEAAVEEAAESVSAEAEESAVPEAAVEEAAENVSAEAEESAVPEAAVEKAAEYKEQENTVQEQHNDEISFFDLQRVPDAFIHKLIELFDQTEGIRNVYLKGINFNGRSGYLGIVDFEGTDPAAFQQIAQIAGPYSEGVSLTFVKYDSEIGRAAAEGSYPFYQRTSMTYSE